MYIYVYTYVYTSHACCWCGRIYLQMKIHQHDGYALFIICIMKGYALYKGHFVFLTFV